MNTAADKFYSRKRTPRQLSRLAAERVVNADLELIVFYARGFDKRYTQGKRERGAAQRATRYPTFTRRPAAEVTRVKIAVALPPASTGLTPEGEGRYIRSRNADQFFTRTGPKTPDKLVAWIERERHAYALHISLEALRAPSEAPDPAEVAALTEWIKAPRKASASRRIKRGQIVVVGMTEDQALAIAARALDNPQRG